VIRWNEPQFQSFQISPRDHEELKKEWGNYLRIALGSTSELETQLLLAKALGFAPSIEINSLLSEVDQISRLLNTYLQRPNKR